MSTPNPVPNEPNNPAPAATPNATPAPVAANPNPTPSPANPPSNVVWPDQWRQTIAGSDEKELKQLERYASPVDIWKKARSFEQRLSSGELRAVTPFPEKGTPEQQTAWRAENGVPDSPDKYQLSLADGLVVGEEDKPIIDSFLKSAHGTHMPPAFANAAVQWYFDFQEQAAEQRAVKDREIAERGTDELRNEWGQDYRPNLNGVHALLDSAPEGIKDMFLGGRMADGTPIGSHPGMLKWLAGVSRQLNPVATLIPGSGNNPDAIGNEIAAIEKTMRENRGAYNADEKMQQRYRDLITAREQLNKK